MSTRSQGKSKFSVSFKHAMDGIGYVSLHERNFKIEIVFGIIAIILGFLFRVSNIEWLVLVITIALVLCFEIINTAIERCVDLISLEYSELAKVTKDASAGAVLVMSMFSLVVGIIIFIPKIINLLR